MWLPCNGPMGDRDRGGVGGAGVDKDGGRGAAEGDCANAGWYVGITVLRGCGSGSPIVVHAVGEGRAVLSQTVQEKQDVTGWCGENLGGGYAGAGRWEVGAPSVTGDCGGERREMWFGLSKKGNRERRRGVGCKVPSGAGSGRVCMDDAGGRRSVY